MSSALESLRRNPALSLSGAQPEALGARQAALVTAWALLHFALQASLLARGVQYITASLTIDDTYYYLQSAWNTVRLGFTTFDGLHPTNGVQFLWFLAILGLALLFKTKTALLLATLVASFACNALCYLVIAKIGALLKRPALALLLAGLWALQSLPFRIYSMGMENSLHALVFWLLIYQCLAFLVRAPAGERPNLWGLTALLILNAWTRLDSALHSAVLYLFCLLSWALPYRRDLQAFARRNARPLIASSLAAGLAGAFLLGAFWFMGGSWLPVSALVKTSGLARGFSAAALQKLVEVLELGLPAVVQGRLPTFALVALALLSILVVLGVVNVYFRRFDDLRPLTRLWSALLVSEGLYHGYIGISGAEYTPYFVWYRSPSFIFWTLTAALIGLYIFEQLRLAGAAARWLRWAPLGASLLAVAAGGYFFVRSVNFTSGLYATRYETALWIADNSPPETVFAAWNTGQLAYFSNRTFINLDGVINSVDYHRRVLRGPVPLADYLYENQVSFIVDYDLYRPLPAFPVVQSFPINDETGRSMHIWQVTPRAAAD